MLLLALVGRADNDPHQDGEGNDDVEHISASNRWRGRWWNGSTRIHLAHGLIGS